MKTRAAVAFEAKKSLQIIELDLKGPRFGEVLVEIMATGICHTDAYTLGGLDSEGRFPSVLGHEGAGLIREVGPGVSSMQPGDHVDVPKIVDWYMNGKIEIDPMITHVLTLDEINTGFEPMHSGESIRSVVVF